MTLRVKLWVLNVQHYNSIKKILLRLLKVKTSEKWSRSEAKTSLHIAIDSNFREFIEDFGRDFLDRVFLSGLMYVKYWSSIGHSGLWMRGILLVLTLKIVRQFFNIKKCCKTKAARRAEISILRNIKLKFYLCILY